MTGRAGAAGRRPGRTATAAAAALAVAAMLSACGAQGPSGADGPADLTGTVGADEAVNGGGPALVDASDVYYEGLALDDGDVVVVDADDAEVGTDALVAGAAVEVWVGDACAESQPVQCDVLAVRVLG
jgi:hypothetical protein